VAGIDCAAQDHGVVAVDGGDLLSRDDGGALAVLAPEHLADRRGDLGGHSVLGRRGDQDFHHVLVSVR
jgi:hypothetical protein